MDEVAMEISVSQFKAKCLSMIEEVARTGLSLIVTKRGKPIAKVISLVAKEPRSLLGSVEYEREEDLRTLQRAEEIRVDKSRLAGAQREANSQMRALKKVQARRR